MFDHEKLSIIEENTKEAPVLLKPITSGLGLKVYSSEFDDPISGMIKKDSSSKSGYSIYVNSTHHKNRIRFTIAHEIAHFILHQENIGNGIVDDAMYRSKLSSTMESEANNYAADLLMPWSLLSNILKKDNNVSVEILAEKFQVSKSTMSIRLRVPYETED